MKLVGALSFASVCVAIMVGTMTQKRVTAEDGLSGHSPLRLSLGRA